MGQNASPPAKPRHRCVRLACFVALCASAWGQSPRFQPLPSGPVDTTTATSEIRAHRFLRGRILSGNRSAAQAMAEARAQHAQMLQQQTLQPRLSGLNAAWQPVGPAQIASLNYGNVTGRISSIAIDPADPTGNTVYLGTTGGGVWKSTNAAGPAASVTFSPLTDTLPVFSANAGTTAIPSLSIGAISIQNGVLLAGTGDTNDATDSYYGTGLLRSTDGGVTWTLISAANGGTYSYGFTGLGFAGFAWSSTGTVVAAVSQSAEGALVNAPNLNTAVTGLYYSTDAGMTWQMSTLMDGSQTVQSPQAPGGNHGGNPSTSVVWNPVRQRFYAAVRYHGYYESADGIAWTRLAQQPGAALTSTACPTRPQLQGSTGCPIFRGTLAVEPVTGDMFALTVDSGNVDQGLWRDICASGGSACAGAVSFAQQINSTSLEIGNGSTKIFQADYNLSLAAIRTGTGSSADTLLYAGTVDLYRCSIAAGCSFRNTTNALNGCSAPAKVAPAQHAIAITTSGTQPVLYLGNDGGLWRSSDGVNQTGTPCSSSDASHFENLNGALGSLAEVVSLAQDPVDPDTVLVGLGANGTVATSTASNATPWTQLSAGEGGDVAIDPSQPSNWYVSTAAGVSIRQCTKGSACAVSDFTGSPTIGAAQVAQDVSLIDAPWLLDPTLSSELIIGTCRVWRGPAASGALWSSSNAISRMLGGTQSSSCSSTNPVIRSIAAGGTASSATSAQNAGAQVLYAGMAGVLDGGGSAGGHVFANTSAGTANSATAWTDLTTSTVSNDTANHGAFNPGGFDISSLTVDTHDSTGSTVYATVMGFSGNGVSAPKVYRSTDAGAHWLNITSNLPNASANSLVVDPNDANTVYAALDTGVYVTTSVTNCPSANCWSVYGGSLPNAPVIQLAAASGMSTGDGRTGELRAATYGRGIWQIPLLTATTAALPAMALSPASLSFASQAVGTASASQTLTVTNSGSAPLTINRLSITGDFSESDNCTASPIAVGSSCTAQILFVPAATGNRTGQLTIYSNVAGGQAVAALSGTATAGSAIVLNPILVNFPSTAVGASSAPINITISNTGANTIALQAPTITGDFTVSANTCGSTLAPQTGCTVAIVFRPTASGSAQGTFSITDDSGTQTAALSGTGTLPATDALSPLALTYAPQQLGTASTAQTVTLTNSGDLALTLIAASATGDFSVVNNCGNSLNAHAGCSLSVIFNPRNVGQETGALTLSDEYRSQTVALSGIGVAPPGVSLAPTQGLTFPSTGVGIPSAPQIITLTNNGGLPLSIGSITVTGDFTIPSGGNTCGATLAQNTACTIQLLFTPAVGGTRNGTLTVTDNAPNSPHTMALTGSGVDFSLAANGATTVNISTGQSAVFPLLLRSDAAVSGTATFTCTGAPTNSTCTVFPKTVSLGNNTTISVTIQTGTTTAAVPASGRIVWFAALVPALFLLRRRRLSAALLCCLIAAAGCGAGRLIPNSGTPGTPSSGTPTPSGSYPITVSATSAGLTRTVNVTLVVQ